MERRELHPTSEQPHQIDPGTLSCALHDLCNPLTLMRVRSQMLRRNIERGRIQEAHECLSALAVIEDATRKMEATLNGLHAMTRMETPFPGVSQSRWPAPDGESRAGPHHREDGQHDE